MPPLDRHERPQEEPVVAPIGEVIVQDALERLRLEEPAIQSATTEHEIFHDRERIALVPSAVRRRETLLPAIECRLGDEPAHRAAEDELPLTGTCLELGGDTRRVGDELVVEERHARLDG